jgi:poly(3-hydroxybutyrate) depolymerase
MKATQACSITELLLVILLGWSTHLQAASTIQFSKATYSVAESAGTVTLTVQRTNDVNTLVSVDYATADGTATNGVKYTAVSGTLSFGGGETNKAIVVPILNEGFVEGSKNFQVILNNPTGRAILGARTNVSVFISDNEMGIQFRYDSYTAAEDAGTVRIGVVRDDDGEAPVTVDYATSDGTAARGLDYIGLTNTLSFGPTERLKCFTIPILNNSLKQPDRTFQVTLSNPTGGSLGSTKTTTVIIRDNDQGFQFDSATYSVAEDAGAALITVLRGADDTNSTFTVDLASTDGTALSGRDYVGLASTLSFAPAERSKVVPIPILNNGIKDGTRNFQVILSNPTGGAALGAPAATKVSILDNDPGVGFELSGYSVWAGAGAITLIVLRGNDGALDPITVDYATADGTAQAGREYQALSGTLEFKEEETVKSLTIPILPGALAASLRTFSVTLSHPTGGAALGTATTTVKVQKSFCSVAPPFDAKLTIRREGGVNVLTWTGGGHLQRADRVTGPWQTLPATPGRSVVTGWSQELTTTAFVAPPIPAAFYRVTAPRPVNLYVPSSYDGHTPMPLVMGLGPLSGATTFLPYFALAPLAESRGFLWCAPDGGMTGPDAESNPWWDFHFEGTDYATELGGAYVDDVAYLASLIEEVARHVALDTKRVYLIGGSAGGFMADLMAAARPDLIAGIASLSGTVWEDEFIRHPPSEPVNILHIHGTADDIVPYWGGTPPNTMLAQGSPVNELPMCGAVRTIQFWAGFNGASGPVTDPAPTLDFTTDLPGLDSVVTRYTNAPPGGAVELWTIINGGHAPSLSAQMAPRIVDWLLAHPKP